jgi:deoxyribonuclease V
MIEVPDIYKEFYGLLAQIPEGNVSTYGDMAIQLGDIVSARAVGEMLSENEHPDLLPCYRVVMSDGALGGYTHPNGAVEKARRLRRDGITISNGKIENFEKLRFREFRSNFPLKTYREQVRKIKLDGKIDHSGGIRSLDISYSGRIGVGVAVNFGKELSYEIEVKEAKSPYIPNYLYLREGEIYESLVRKGMINVIDGNGILHRDGRGVATLVGAAKEVATVGLAKSLLIGEERGNEIFIGRRKVGEKVGKYFVSKGFGIGLSEGINALIKEGHFPQTKFADRLSRRYKDEILPAQYSL